MLTLRIQCNVPPDRTITLKLPDQVKPGQHELVLVVDKTGHEEDIISDAEKLMKFSGAVPTFSGVDGVKYQRSLRDEWP
ncbi:MAG: hypothetical protein HQL01_07530 [Nitrospirae bacterium]|nr:hypothetical protein [Nitrospirota bacterium]